MEPAERVDEPAKDGLPERLLTLGTWVVAIIASVIVVALVVFLVRFGLGDLGS